MKRCNIILLLMLLLFASCTENKEVKELFVRVDSLMDEYPDSALAMLDSAYSHKGEWRRSQQMRYELLRAKAQNKAYVDFTTDSVMKEVVEYYDAHGTANEQMEAHYLLGCTYRDLHESPMALSCYLDATEKADTLSDDCDYGTLMRIWGQVADEFYRQGMPYKELEANEKYRIYAIKNNDSLNYAIGIELDRRPYFTLRDTVQGVRATKMAFGLFEEMGYICDAAQALPPIINVSLARRDITTSHKLMQYYESKSGLFDDKKNIAERHEIYYEFIARYKELVGELDSAEYYYRKLWKYGYDYEACSGLLNIYQQLSNHDSICKYSSLKDEAFNRYFTHHHTEAMFNVDGMFNYSRNQKIAMEKEAEANRNHKIILVVILISLLLFFFIYNRYKKKERENDKVKMDYLLMQERFSRTKEDLKLVKSNYSEYIKSKEQELEEIKSCIKGNEFISTGVAEQENINRIMQRNEIKVFLDVFKLDNSHTPNDIDWEALTTLISNELPQFYARITKGNILSKTELRATILTRLGFSTTELSFIMDKPLQRITNLKSLANKKLFNDKGAKSFYENMIETAEKQM